MTIEDAAELSLRQPHVVRLEARPPNVEGRGEVTIRRLVRNALRMRPDRIVVGEVRGGEALDLLTALSTGHDGSLSTVHAGSPAEALRRVETLALMAGLGLPHAALREQVADAFDLVVCQARGADGARRVVAVAEVVRVAGGAAARELYSWREGRGRWRAALSDPLAARLTRGRSGRGGRATGAPTARAGRARVTLAAVLAFAAAACGRRVGAARGGGGHAARRGARPDRRAGRARRARGPRADRARAEAARAARHRRLLFAGWLLGGAPLAVLAATAGPALAVAVVRARSRRYAASLRRGAPEAARALADALGSGHSVRGAIAAAAASVPGPAGHELARAARALALGEPPAVVLERLRRRAAGPAWDTLVAGILLQRDAGGDLAGLLRELAASLEAAARVDADARAATAQARFTARLVLWLPAGAALLAELASPGFAAITARTAAPAALVAAAAGLQVLAVLAIRRLA